MNRPVYVLNILPRENRHVEARPVRDIWEIVQGSTALFLWVLIGVLVMA